MSIVTRLPALLLTAAALVGVGCDQETPATHTRSVKHPTRAPVKHQPPPGVYEVGGAFFLVKVGYESNMRHLCDETVYDSGDSYGVHVKNVRMVAQGWWEVQCDNEVGYKYADKPLVTRPTP